MSSESMKLRVNDSKSMKLKFLKAKLDVNVLMLDVLRHADLCPRLCSYGGVGEDQGAASGAAHALR